MISKLNPKKKLLGISVDQGLTFHRKTKQCFQQNEEENEHIESAYRERMWIMGQRYDGKSLQGDNEVNSVVRGSRMDAIDFDKQYGKLETMQREALRTILESRKQQTRR